MSWSTRTFRVLIGVSLLGQSSWALGSARSSTEHAPPASCLDRIRAQARLGSPIAITDTSGVSTRGKLRRSDPGSETLTLDVYDSPTSRFVSRDIPLQEIALVRGRSEHTSLKPAVFGAILLGSLGLIVGQGFANDPDAGTARSRETWEVGFPVLGVAAGFFLGMVLTPTRTVEWEIDCP